MEQNQGMSFHGLLDGLLTDDGIDESAAVFKSEESVTQLLSDLETQINHPYTIGIFNLLKSYAIKRGFFSYFIPDREARDNFIRQKNEPPLIPEEELGKTQERECHTITWGSCTHHPLLESLDQIVDELSPEGKDILSVAGFGYPLAFLANGAERVVSFDISPRAVGWNNFLRASIALLSYEDNLEIFGELDGNEFELFKAVALDATPDLQKFPGSQSIVDLKKYDTRYPFLQFFPHLKDEATFERVSRIIFL
jgi:hypothetical protein